MNITIPRETFDAMREALERITFSIDCKYLRHDDQREAWRLGESALSAAKAVSGLTNRYTEQPQAQGEAVAFLCDGTRFKVRQNEGDEAARIYGLPSELNGRWVALVAADDDCHLKMTHPQASEPAWMPIETAPKDFVTEFDGWNGERVPNVSWAHPEYSPKGHYAWCVSEYESHNGWVNTEVKNLTHWMPLPAAPEANK